MKAWVLHEIGKLKYEDIESPVPKAGEALVRVGATGICGSDIPRAFVEGAHVMPIVIGHEFAGTVEAVGDPKDEHFVGKHVGVFPLIPCGNCIPCRKKQYELCRDYGYIGSRVNGAFAEYVTVPVWNLIEIPQGVSLETAAMLEPMAVAVHAMRQIELHPQDSVLVWGLGTIGLFLTMFLKEMGIKKILVVGNKEQQREMAFSLGVPAAHCFDSSEDHNEEALRAVLDATDGYGVHAAFECVGINETYASVLSAVHPGGSVCIVGNPRSDMMIDRQTYWKILRNQLTVHGTWNSAFRHEAADDWHYVLGRLADGRIDPSKLITHRFSLDEIDRGFKLMRDRTESYIKVMAVQDET